MAVLQRLLLCLALLNLAVRLTHSLRPVQDAAALSVSRRAPEPTPWPHQFHAVLFENRSSKLAMVDLYYDWPGRRNLNLIRYQQGSTTYDVEWNNRTSFIFDRDANSCRTINFTVGILRPDWLAGATYLGDENVDNRTAHVFTKEDFITYYEDVHSGRPVRWRFHTSGGLFEVMAFHEGATAPESEWQAPASCFR